MELSGCRWWTGKPAAPAKEAERGETDMLWNFWILFMVLYLVGVL